MNNTNTQHTPGPWTNLQGSILPERLAKHAAHKIATVHENHAEHNAANARLIAAAPDLLEALKRCEAALDWYVTNTGESDIESMSHARGVIKKATQ